MVILPSNADDGSGHDAAAAAAQVGCTGLGTARRIGGVASQGHPCAAGWAPYNRKVFNADV